ncbi:MAG: metallophosphoesterase [Planctomycetota bacterium]
MKTLAVDLLNAEGVAELLGRATESLLRDPLRTGCCVTLPARGRLLATGDLHDHPIHYQKVRAFAQLERADHHLILHELIHGERLHHGVDLSWRMLAKTAALRLDHPGQVHPMLANHEIAQAFGQPVSKGAGENTQLFRDGLAWSFGDDAGLVDEAIGAFIRALPLAIRTGNGLLCSHSLPSPLAMAKFDLGVLGRELVDADFEPRHGAAWNMTWGRGQTRESVETLAQAWGVSLFVAGHKHVEEGVEAPFPRLLLVNTDHERAAVVPFDLSQPAPTSDEAMLNAVPLAAIGGDHG